ncbi:DUF6355 family natural product biosynthesis protein [Allokutzneria oryzae]|uniref:DUF6355 family natural product biosynthesis protein n=1 Tax=Allokutzneria oryzae TaxID=1378989 RepID=A0ABV5ZZE1_9PSEU
MRKILGLALPLFAVLGMTAIAAPSASAAPCGWYKIGDTGYHNHCGTGLILVKYHWSNGNTGTTCQGPGIIPFYPDGPHQRVNAYYVPKKPATMINAAGQEICRTGQPSYP